MRTAIANRQVRRSAVVALSAALAVTATALAPVDSGPLGPRRAHAAATVCLNDPVPAGHVVLSYPNSPICPPVPIGSTIGNAKLVEVPAPGMIICSGGPFPAGYVFTAYETVLSPYTCGDVLPGSTTGNARTIQLPSVGLVVCDGSPVPAGFKVGSTTTTPQCGTPVLGSPLGNARVLAAA